MSEKPTYEELEQKVRDLERVAKDLRDNEQRFPRMLNVVPDLISIHSSQMDILYSNWQGFAAVPESMRILNTKCYKTYRGFDSICPDCRAKEVMDTGQPLEIETKLPDGKWFDLRVIPLVDNKGKIEMFIEWVRDITNRKLTEEALSESEKKYRYLVENANSIILRMDINGNITFLNEYAQRFFGYDKKEIMGRNVVGTIVPVSESTGRDLKAMIEDIVYKPEIYATNENENIRKDGKRVWIAWTNKAIRNEQGAIIEILCVGNDITERRQAEEKLRQSEENYRLLAENVTDVIWTMDMNMRFTYYSPSVERLQGYTPEEAMARTIQESLTADSLEKAIKVFNEELEEQSKGERDPSKSITLELEVTCKDGTTKMTEIQMNFTYNLNGHPVGIIGVTRDISERKRAEEALRESEEKHNNIVDSAGEGIVVIQDGIINFLNRRMTEMMGLSSTDISRLSNESFLSFIHPEDQKQVADHYDRRLKGQELPSTYSVRLIDKGGESLWVDLSPTTISWEGKPAILTFVTDITKRKKNEEELQKLASVVKYSSELVNLATLDGKMIFINEAGGKMLGIDPDEVEQVHIMEVIPDHFTELVQNELLPALLEGDTWEGELQYRNLKTGELTDVHGMTFTVQEPKTGKPMFLANVSYDITDRKIAEKEKIKLEAQLQQAQKMEAIGTLAGGIAHDFNNILSPIMAHTEMALMDLPGDSPITFGLKEVYKASERARDLVKQILAFSRQTEQKPVPIKLGFIIKEALKLLRSSIPTTIEIRQKVVTRSDAILADPTQMHQVIMNLCTNAFHSMREKGGIIGVILTDEYVDIESINNFSELSPGSYLKLSVSDTGQGIDTDLIEKIFEPYFTTKDKGVGTGLGLAVVHGIVKNHGGSIQVSSELGKGTVFNVYLPRLEKKAIEQIPIEEQVPRGNEKILFIDDEAAIIEVAKKMLGRLGYEVITRTSSTDALELFRSQPDQFDIVITDMTMPNMTGKELTKELMSIRPDIPVILCTGFSEQIDERKAYEMGIRAFVMKPIAVSEIANTLRDVLDKK
jgi:PAS domain S-box-containing protein